MKINISGLIGSGKDTLASYLVTNYGFTKLSFAGTLKDAICPIFGWDRSMLEGDTPEAREWRNQVDQWWSNRLGIPNFTPRYAMQYIGTNVMRNHFHDQIWVASLEKKMSQIENVVITDCRFRNEFDLAKNAGAKSIRVVRGELPEWTTYAEIAMNDRTPELIKEAAVSTLNKMGIHPSEYSSFGVTYDYVIKNDTNLSYLYKSMDDIIASTRR